jgi:hypothetical protein
VFDDEGQGARVGYRSEESDDVRVVPDRLEHFHLVHQLSAFLFPGSFCKKTPSKTSVYRYEYQV